MMSRFLFALLLLPTLAVAAPLRVISLSPHTTELAYEAGLGDNLIAVSAHSDYPPEALELEQVANYRGINIERVVTLKPDLVLAWQGGNPDKELAKLERLGIEVFTPIPIRCMTLPITLKNSANGQPLLRWQKRVRTRFVKSWQRLKPASKGKRKSPTSTS